MSDEPETPKLPDEPEAPETPGLPEPIYLVLERADVVSYMGRGYPPRPGAPRLVLPPEAELTDGAVCVYPEPGRPGYTWWVLESTVYVQDAGTPDEALAALIPGSVLGSVPDPDPNPQPPLS
ncbi:hypothetical protein AB0A91_16410 [Streptomyces sp. NPDC042207]|uniref:hypothetical protein n=1 Tax=Streptomyces sp. NPDC042207 TaxID=3154331 RepID=UPI0033E9600C